MIVQKLHSLIECHHCINNDTSPRTPQENFSVESSGLIEPIDAAVRSSVKGLKNRLVVQEGEIDECIVFPLHYTKKFFPQFAENKFSDVVVWRSSARWIVCSPSDKSLQTLLGAVDDRWHSICFFVNRFGYITRVQVVFAAGELSTTEQESFELIWACRFCIRIQDALAMDDKVKWAKLGRLIEDLFVVARKPQIQLSISLESLPRSDQLFSHWEFQRSFENGERYYYIVQGPYEERDNIYNLPSCTAIDWSPRSELTISCGIKLRSGKLHKGFLFDAVFRWKMQFALLVELAMIFRNILPYYPLDWIFELFPYVDFTARHVRIAAWDRVYATIDRVKTKTTNKKYEL